MTTSQFRLHPLVLDMLNMLVTPSPLAELDAALMQAVDQLRRCRSDGDQQGVAIMQAWIDERLDERLTFRE